MKLLVCVKQVPESETAVAVTDDVQWVRIGHGAEYRMNRYDECALEEAVRIKENVSGTSIDIVSIGPQRADTSIRRALGMGADDGLHIVTDREKYLDPFATASWIAQTAQKKDYDLILTGAMSEDLMQGQVGPMTAELLSCPCATNIVDMALSSDAKSIQVEREIEGGSRELLELTFPVLLTVQTGINKPRYPSLSNLLRANQKKLHTIDAATFEFPKIRQDVVQTALPQKIRKGDLLEGTQDEKAVKLINILREKSLLHL
jgi:electron transfer flavoprotein beta subunit